MNAIIDAAYVDNGEPSVFEVHVWEILKKIELTDEVLGMYVKAGYNNVGRLLFVFRKQLHLALPESTPNYKEIKASLTQILEEKIADFTEKDTTERINADVKQQVTTALSNNLSIVMAVNQCPFDMNLDEAVEHVLKTNPMPEQHISILKNLIVNTRFDKKEKIMYDKMVEECPVMSSVEDTVKYIVKILSQKEGDPTQTQEVDYHTEEYIQVKVEEKFARMADEESELEEKRA